jgi:hypothetical protein
MTFAFSDFDALVALLATVGAWLAFVGIAWLADRLLSLRD